jgi:tRNA threonylcarbamoyl adenosine modification protein (Sua5/YciO/YrdC/YwlC family)
MARPLPDVLPIRWPDSAPTPPAETGRALDRAAQVLADGGLVAIPTETVYGLAAIATDAHAVEKIFAAKGRPQTNPLIVHVADVAMARALAASWPATADRIASCLWPGPVTLVVPRGPQIPDVVTAGGDTVAVRCPAERLARLLIEKVGRPLAAPSANRSLAVSPTTAAHVLESLGNRIDLILDGGACQRGARRRRRRQLHADGARGRRRAGACQSGAKSARDRAGAAQHLAGNCGAGFRHKAAIACAASP